MKASAAVIREPGGQFLIEEVELDDLRKDEVLIRVEACGVCHTDVVAQSMIELPGVFGHEGVGVVEATGSAVQWAKPGDRVVAAYPSCGCCSNCHDGAPYICEHTMAIGFGGARADQSKTIKLDGKPISSAFFQQSTFASHAITIERNLVPVAKDIASELLAAIPCGIQTGAGSVANSLGVKPMSSLAVFGTGAVGLSAIMMAKVIGVNPIIAVDVNPDRLELALELGAHHIINAMDGDVTKQLLEICPKGLNYSFETSANEQALNDAIACLGMGGRCGIVTSPHMGEKYPFSPSELMFRGASLEGIIQGAAIPRTFLPKLLKLNKQGLFPYERLIKNYDFVDINQAFADSKSGHVIKPVLKMS